MKNITLLGSTGSIGKNTLEVVRHHRNDMCVVAMTAGSNAKLLGEQIREFEPDIAALADESCVSELGDTGSCKVTCGKKAVVDTAVYERSDIVVSAIVGSAGLVPTLKAIEAGKDIALANKEPLVMAGELIKQTAHRENVNLLPVDSEHSAVFQALQSGRHAEVNRIYLTASGGPFHKMDTSGLADVTKEQALNHPTWSMGQKITIDSATLMNKALEIIEAHWLFDVPYEKIKVLVHPQSIVHSMIEFVDGSVIAQMGVPSMKLPIQYALTYPDRIPGDVPAPDFIQIGQLTFEDPNEYLSRGLDLAYRAGTEGGTSCAVLNGANEAAVELFLNGRCRFEDIYSIIESAMDIHQTVKDPSITDIIRAGDWAKDHAENHETN